MTWVGSAITLKKRGCFSKTHVIFLVAEISILYTFLGPAFWTAIQEIPLQSHAKSNIICVPFHSDSWLRLFGPHLINVSKAHISWKLKHSFIKSYMGEHFISQLAFCQLSIYPFIYLLIPYMWKPSHVHIHSPMRTNLLRLFLYGPAWNDLSCSVAVKQQFTSPLWT